MGSSTFISKNIVRKAKTFGSLDKKYINLFYQQVKYQTNVKCINTKFISTNFQVKSITDTQQSSIENNQQLNTQNKLTFDGTSAVSAMQGRNRFKSSRLLVILLLLKGYTLTDRFESIFFLSLQRANRYFYFQVKNSL